MWENLRHVTLGTGLLISACAGVTLAQAEPPAPAPAPAPTPAASAEKKGNINLQLNGVGADEAFDQLAKQAGVDLMVQDQQLWANADPIDLQVTDGYFWPTFLEMCNQSRIRFNPYYGGNEARTIILERSRGQETTGMKAPSVEYQGNIIRAMAANRSASVNYENPGSANSQFSIQFAVMIDPTLRPTGNIQVTLSEAVDDLGNSLVPPQRDGGMMYGGQNGLVCQAGAALLAPSNMGKKITRLKGYVRMSSTTKSEVVEIENPLAAQPVKKETSEQEITIQPLKKTGQGNQKSYELKVSFRAKDRQPGGLRRPFNNDAWSMVSKIDIRDADGKRISYSGGGGGGGPEGTQEYTVNFNGSGQVGEPVKLTWRIPTEIREIRIPFTFTDLAIPQN